ncbi:MAG: hypothetical protein ACLPID_06220 [Beijerinckiaceae bacterium]
MSPQPLSRVKRDAKFLFSTKALLDHPELCSAAMRIIDIGSRIEHTWSLILVDLLKSDPRVGVSMYQALTSSDARRAALMAAAKVKLSSQDFLLFQACFEAVAPVRRLRNSFAHHLWGSSSDVPNALLLADPEDFLRQDVNAAEAKIEMEATGRVAYLEKIDTSEIQVWKKASFERALKEAQTAHFTLRELGTGLHVFGPGINVKTRELLLNRPLVSQALQRLSKRNTQ